MSRVLLASMVASTALGLALIPGHALAGFPGHNGRIAFLGETPESSMPQIVLIKADGSGQTQISFEGYHYDPTWSADGTKLAFAWADTSSSDIWTAAGDGSDRRQVTSGSSYDYHPTWSPDGHRIAFERQTPTTASDIYAVNSNGSGLRKLADRAVGPAWSPDGRQIAFASDRAGQDGVYVMNANGSHPVQLATKGTMPDWSPNGSKIVYAVQQTGASSRMLQSGPPPPPPTYFHLWMMNADGSHAHRLTSDAGDQMVPAWSPDGLEIAYSGRPPEGGYQQLYVLNVAEGTSVHLTQGSTPSWQPLDPPCRVPNVVGRKLDRARAAILRAHCGVGRVRRARSRRAGRVISQSPRGGVVKPAGYRIKLVVGRR